MSIIPIHQAGENQQGWGEDWGLGIFFFFFLTGDGAMTHLIITYDLFYFNVQIIFT